MEGGPEEYSEARAGLGREGENGLSYSQNEAG